MSEFTVETESKTDVVDVTERVREAVPAGADGVATVFVRHTTAGVVVNEAESRLLDDVETFLADLVPDEGWKHDRLDGNADSHLRALLLGESVQVPVTDGDLDVGTWQSILLVECDGPRTRSVTVRVT
ncbi:secondary thiamine-phosphate synthase enzyme YjbQ [Halospeciosus flavus]|uniref:Secondary thiamine-phosphate synthase enzyme YjbQ n=1 Tax=Halospeciosus flavus TaxID=3032283 RepID=A0ABD5Z7G0_9EURY|nr:secondary thiamine-phosphate synthase enzyme YjbQ [Halospeciosus flavus]